MSIFSGSPEGNRFNNQDKPEPINNPRDNFYRFANFNDAISGSGDGFQSELNFEQFRNFNLTTDLGFIITDIFQRDLINGEFVKKFISPSIFDQESSMISFEDILFKMLKFSTVSCYLLISKEGSSKSPLDGELLKVKPIYNKEGKATFKGYSFAGFTETIPKDPVPERHFKLSFIDKGTSMPFWSLTESVYKFLFQLFTNMQYNLNLANTLQFKFSGYRELAVGTEGGMGQKNQFREQFQKQVSNMKNVFRSNPSRSQAVTMDVNDKMELYLPDMKAYEEGFMMGMKRLSKIIQVPLARLLGESPKGMNATGEYDDLMLTKTSKRWYNGVIAPLFCELAYLFGQEEPYFDYSDYQSIIQSFDVLARNIMVFDALADEGYIDKEKIKNITQRLLNGQ